MEPTVSGVGVLDKSFAVLALVTQAPCSLAELVEGSSLTRATAHRLALALETHGLLRRLSDGRFALGLNLVALGRAATEQFPLAEAARAALTELQQTTAESVQLYVRDGNNRVCILALESPHGLRTIVAVGAALPLDVGSAGRVLLGERAATGWMQTVGEREAGVASVSAGVFGPYQELVAAVSVSGPIDRLSRSPGKRYGAEVLLAASKIETALAALTSKQ
ncbi:MAG: IclR family transcriptional regulator [Microthrixaceae bacterium]